jgi:membrane associated rhomboid family serine protease
MVFSVAVYAAIAAGFMLAEHGMAAPALGRLWRPWPVATTVAVLVTGTVSVLQLTAFPVLLGDLRRDGPAVRDGELWRLVTALTAQDGGWVGFAFNIVTLALIGVLAEHLLGRRRCFLAFGVPALVAEVVALWWQPVGAGSSVAVSGLCGAVAVAALGRAPYAVPAVVSAAAFVVLASTGDIHGAAGVSGLAVGLVLRVTQPDTLPRVPEGAGVRTPSPAPGA